MCGRYELKASARELLRYCRDLELRKCDVPYGDEMRPAAPVLMLAREPEGHVARRARWGLVGSFLNAEPLNPPSTLCAEGLVTKPFYSKTLQKNRCLMPATAFFEWQVLADGQRQQLRFSAANGKAMMFAGVFDHHPQAGMTCALVTTPADAVVGAAHGRMPLILNAQQSAFWLDDYADFPAEDFDALMQHPSPCAFKVEVVSPADISPQLPLFAC